MCLFCTDALQLCSEVFKRNILPDSWFSFQFLSDHSACFLESMCSEDSYLIFRGIKIDFLR